MRSGVSFIMILIAGMFLPGCPLTKPATLGFPGPLDYSAWDTTFDADLPITVYYPAGPAPERGYPTVIFNVGWNQTRAAYQTYGIELAQWGYVAIIRAYPCLYINGFGYDNTDEQLRQISALLDWTAAQNADSTSPLHGLVDVTKSGCVGHSLGGRQSVAAAHRDPRFGAVVDMDSVEESALLPLEAFVPDIHTPILWMRGEVLCESLHNSIDTSLYGETNPPTADVVISKASHLDFIESFQGMNRFAPLFCTSMGADSNDIRATAVALTVAWLNLYLKGESEWSSYFDGADAARLIDEGKAQIDVRWAAGS